MTVERTGVIDLVTESKEGVVHLVMTEDRPWDRERLGDLQAKLNTYLVRIQLDYVFPPDEFTREFLARAANICEESGIELWMNQL